MKKFHLELTLSLLFFFFSIAALLPCFLVKLGNYRGNLIDRVEAFVSAYDGLLVSLGTVFLVLNLGIFSTFLAEQLAAAREMRGMRISAEMKLSEFRQAWINSLRDDLSNIVGNASFVDNIDDRKRIFGDMKILDAKIGLRLNPNKEAERKVKEMVFKVVYAFESQSEDLPRLRGELASKGAIFIKDQWEELKGKLPVSNESQG